jgi:hypothetical protein
MDIRVMFPTREMGNDVSVMRDFGRQLKSSASGISCLRDIKRQERSVEVIGSRAVQCSR